VSNRYLDNNNGFKSRSRVELLSTSSAGTSILTQATRLRDVYYFGWRCDPPFVGAFNGITLFTLDEGCPPCVRHSFLSTSLREMVDYAVRVTLWTKGVASTEYPSHRLEGYSLLIRDIINSPESDVFTLD